MSLRRFTILLAIMLGLAASLRAEDKKPADKKSDDNTASAEDKAKDRYQIPEKASVKELIDYFNELRSFRTQDRQELMNHQRKMLANIKTIGDRIRELANEEDKKLEGYDTIVGMWWQIRASELPRLSAEKQQEFIDELRSALTATPTPDKFVAGAAMQAASAMERANPERAAKKLYRDFGPLVAKCSDPQIAAYGPKMEGAARRLELVGNPLEISGRLMDGSKFNWNSYRGKVVLVDFWATWCGPCMAELPNVKKNYELYHDRGFDVVGISLDEDRAALEAFIEKEQNPWPTIHDGAWNDNAVANYYGIMGIPTVILVDKEGKVVSTRARGPELGKLLASLLGPAEEPDAEKTGDSADKK